MNFRSLALLTGLVLTLAPGAQTRPAVRPPALRYKFAAGETLRFLIQRDPYFDDPAAAIETVSPDAPYRPPVVERLTEQVQAVAANGTATLRLTLTPEPGFEDDTNPQPPLSRTVAVRPNGEVVPAISGGAVISSPQERDLLRGIVPLTAFPARLGISGPAVSTRTLPIAVTESRSPDHDGTLIQTTRVSQTDHVVFDGRQGQLVRVASTLTATISLVMTARGPRGSDDFGHVIPNVQTVQTLTVERQTD